MFDICKIVACLYCEASFVCPEYNLIFLKYFTDLYNKLNYSGETKDCRWVRIFMAMHYR